LTHERTLYNLEQIEAIMGEIPLVLQPIISVQSVQLGAYGEMEQPAMCHFSTIQAGKSLAGQFPATGLLARSGR
jgi:hypothetical protein